MKLIHFKVQTLLNLQLGFADSFMSGALGNATLAHLLQCRPVIIEKTNRLPTCFITFYQVCGNEPFAILFSVLDRLQEKPSRYDMSQNEGKVFFPGCRNLVPYQVVHLCFQV